MPPSISMSIGRPAASARELAQLLDRAGNEFLPAEAWIDRHDQDQIDEIDDRCDRVLRRSWIQGHAGLLAQRPDRLQRTVEVRAGFHVHGDDVGPRFGEGLKIGIARRDHEVHVEHLGGVRAQRLHHVGADRDVGYEMAVHDIDVDPVGAGLIDGAHLLAELGEIGSEDRRSDDQRTMQQVLHGAGATIEPADRISPPVSAKRGAAKSADDGGRAFPLPGNERNKQFAARLTRRSGSGKCWFRPACRVYAERVAQRRVRGADRCHRARGRHCRHLLRGPSRQTRPVGRARRPRQRWARGPRTATPASSPARRSFRRPFRRIGARSCASRSSARRWSIITSALCRAPRRGSRLSSLRRGRRG